MRRALLTAVVLAIALSPNAQTVQLGGGASVALAPDLYRGNASKTSNIRIYAGAGHAFMNRENQQGYNERAAVDAWKRIDDFFANRLRVNMPNS